MLHAYGKQNVDWFRSNCFHVLSETESAEDIEAARKALFFFQMIHTTGPECFLVVGSCIFGQILQEEGLQKYEKYLPKITDDDMKLISEPIDIYGQNIYNGQCIRMGKDGHPETQTL